MNLRRAALLVAITAGCYFLYVLASLVAIVVRFGGPVFLLPPIGLLCFLFSQAIFFAFLFAESSRRTGNHARATAALAATALTLFTAVSAVWQIANTISFCGRPNVHCAFSVPAAAARGAFGVLVIVGWAAFFFAFTEKVHLFRSDLIPKLAVLVGIVGLVGVMVPIIAPSSPRTLDSMIGDAISLCPAIAFLVFAVVLYRKWDTRKPMHDIILGETPQLNPKQNPSF